MAAIPETTIRAILDRAVRAPSSHNTQPWLFEVAGDTVCLHADRRRALPVNDPEDRELTISCGAALLTLRAAAAGEGIGAAVTAFPDADDPDLLARVRLGGEADPELAALAPLIERRRTYRKRFAEAAVEADRLRPVLAAAVREGAMLTALEDEEARAGIAALVSEGDQCLWADRRWRRELAAWMHPRRKGDGLTMPGLAVPVAQLVVRSFDMGGGTGARDAEIAEHSPVLALLGTPSDGPEDWLAAGQALQAALLAATGAGLQASYLNQPIQVAHLRQKLQSLVPGAGIPQVLLRLGVPGEELPAAPRRPLEEVLLPG